MKKILVFAGTTEGKALSYALAKSGIACTASVATEYGTQVMDADRENLTILTGRLNQEKIENLLKENDFVCVVDATHPYAVEATKAIKAACAAQKVTYFRLSRDTTTNNQQKVPSGIHGINITQKQNGSISSIVEVKNLEEALAFLREHPGNILAMTGSKEIGKIAKGLGDSSRLFARVLPSQESIRLCEEAGLTGKQILAMQGPFSERMNIAMLDSVKASFLLTKETGAAGGFFEKLSAAQKMGVCAVIISNPEKGNEGLSFEETITQISKLTEIQIKYDEEILC
ncbi:MAG: precorrin-6A/cobalt-precorrin-6A reductase [Lachnospiraceae bacterium]|nr:precorrin-6A/cobalt-precorrin-6A reductase [Lachnospiraceae bacterium]